MVGFLSRWFADRRKIAALQTEVEELKGIIRNLIPMAENSVDYRIAGDELFRRYKELKGVGYRKHAGVA